MRYDLYVRNFKNNFPKRLKSLKSFEGIVVKPIKDDDYIFSIKLKLLDYFGKKKWYEDGKDSKDFKLIEHVWDVYYDYNSCTKDLNYLYVKTHDTRDCYKTNQSLDYTNPPPKDASDALFNYIKLSSDDVYEELLETGTHKTYAIVYV